MLTKKNKIRFLTLSGGSYVGGDSRSDCLAWARLLFITDDNLLDDRDAHAPG